MLEVGVRLIDKEIYALINYHKNCWKAATHKGVIFENYKQLSYHMDNVINIKNDFIEIEQSKSANVNQIINDGPWQIINDKKSRWISSENYSEMLSEQNNNDKPLLLADAISCKYKNILFELYCLE